MSSREESFLSFYAECRFAHQLNFYRDRMREFTTAHEQAILILAGLMALGAGAGALAAANIGQLRLLWGVLGVLFPALSTALTAYDKLYAFDQQAKLYRDATNALIRLQAAKPEPPSAPGEQAAAAYHSAVVAYVNGVESIFRREQGQWGQLVSKLETTPVQPHATEAPPAP